MGEGTSDYVPRWHRFEDGTWVVSGPASKVKARTHIEVYGKRDKVQVYITHVTKTWTHKGTRWCFGYTGLSPETYK